VCGVAGVLERTGSPVAPELLQRMGDVIAHRGPDGEGQFTEGPVGLVNRRLAIIDPTPAGAMPMASGDGRYRITYNGEVYNFAELRSELEASGHRFRSHTDTEVVLNAYAAWGPASVKRFNGMFALAIWDRERSELFLARDRFGVKPLYYADLPGAFLFGSEIKSMLEHDAMRARLSLPHLLEYFTFQNIFTAGTLFADVQLLRPGHHLTVRADGGPVRSQQYWDFDFREEAGGVSSDDEYQEELDRLFRQAVRARAWRSPPTSA
jgi:asparagine synthase (glutamine-hydrolysing)